MSRSAYLALALAALFTASGGLAHDFKAGNLVIAHPWARPTGASVANGAAYMSIVNSGSAAETLRVASSPLARMVEIHKTETGEDGISRMLAQPQGIVIAPGQTVDIQPAGYHLMLVGLVRPLQRDEKVPLTLEFADAGSITVELAVQMRPSTAAAHDAGRH